MHFIPKGKDEISIMEETKAMCSMIVKNDDFKVEVDLRVLEEDPMGYQEKDCLVEEKACFLEEGGEECGFDSKEDEVVPKVKDVSLVDGVFDGASGEDGDEDFAKGDGV
ncbi:hypothetical protein Tco_0308642 [Tanacetum coccineum]